jgi:KUP system potassium uptake protein
VTAPAAPPGPGRSPRGSRAIPLAAGALGVVYGDIGTSPLYALGLCFTGEHGVAASEPNVLGVLSLVFWSLTLVVSVQYLGFFLRADNRGEGGIFSLLALVPGTAGAGRGRSLVVLLALFGAALLYGDGVITPAISVLSAVEGLGVATDAAEPYVVPLSAAILVGLFLLQKRGTAWMGRLFGPVMLLWFLAIAALGVPSILRNPHVLEAANPARAFAFVTGDPGRAFVVLGSVVLCITGVEALFADMGHFGRAAIRRSWFAVVLPSLLLSYFGQGAHLLDRPDSAVTLFYSVVPTPLLLPMTALATAATVIASQAMISGAFSITRQAVQLGYLPRVRIVHTSSELPGQVYVPSVNGAMMLACLALVVAFRDSAGLAAAYGIAVTGAMTMTTLIYYAVVTRRWGWSLWRAGPLLAAFLAFNLSFFGSSLLKVMDGGWIPLVIAVVAFVSMVTWKDGREALRRLVAVRELALDAFLEDLARRDLHRVPGTAVFMSSSPGTTPLALLHQVKHNKVLHEHVILLSVVTAEVPALTDEERVVVEELGRGITRLVARYGYMEAPDVPDAMERAGAKGLKARAATATFFLSRQTLLMTGASPMATWRKKLFGIISLNAQPPTAFFGLPPGRVVELGMQVEL